MSEALDILSTVLRRLQAEYDEVAVELHTEIRSLHARRFEATNACGKKSGLARAIQIVKRAMREGGAGHERKPDDNQSPRAGGRSLLAKGQKGHG